MDKETIITLIKWGPVVLLLITFLIGFIVGIIKGRRKAVKGIIYQTIFIVAAFLLTPLLTKYLLTIEVNGTSVSAYINDFINNNETMKSMYEQIPSLEEVIKNYPSAIVSLVLFLVLVFVGMPLSFPIYIIYSIIYNAIYKAIFKYSKYERDANGEIKRDSRGKKIKAKHRKHRLAGGTLKGLEGALITSFIFMPVGVITRLYESARQESDKELSDIEYLKNYKDYFDYINAFNDSIIGKATNSVVNKGLAGYLTQINVGGEKTTLENDLNSVVLAAVYVENSGIIELIKDGVDIKTLDLSKVNIDKLEKAIEALFKSATIKALMVEGTTYVLNNNLKETLIEYTDDQDIVSKLKYDEASEIKQDLLRVTSLVKDIINAKLLTSYQESDGNYVHMVNEVKTADVESILNKVLSIKILSNAMPSVATKLLKDKGLEEELTKENNSQFVSLLVNLVKLVKTLEIEKTSDLTDGNVMENLTNHLYVEGAIKSNSVDALATLLAEVNTGVFRGVVVKYLNDFLEKYEIKLNAMMLTKVTTKQEWKEELGVLDNIFKLYKDYQDTQVVDFLTANELITRLKGTKAMILALPIAYQKVFPNLGIEVDLDKIKYIDYTQDNYAVAEAEFYTYWREQLVHFETISDELAKLRIESMDDVSLNLLENPNNVESLATIVSEVFATDLIKDGVTKLFNDQAKDLLVDYDVNLGDSVIDNVNGVTTNYPYYIKIAETMYNVRLGNDDKYYLALAAHDLTQDIEVAYDETTNKITYDAHEYTLEDSTNYLVWEEELKNLSNIAIALKNGDFTDRDNLSSILNSLDKMYLLKDAKNDLLVYAVKQINILPEEKVNALDKSTLDFTKEKDIIINVISEYDTLQDITGTSFAFKDMSDETITTLSSILGGDKGVLKSDIFGDYVADKIVSFVPDGDAEEGNDYGITKNLVLASNTWENDLTLMRDAMNMDADSFSVATLDTLFTRLENSDLIKNQKEELLLKTARQINIAGVDPIDSSLTAEQINYYDEKQALLTFAGSKELVESVSTMKLGTMNTTSIANILADGIKSKMFGPSIVSSLVTVITDPAKGDLKHDLDTGSSNTHLINTINDIGNSTLEDFEERRDANRAKWKAELDVIKSLTSIADVNGVSNSIFTDIENNSRILSGCRAHALMKMIKTANSADNTLNLNEPAVTYYTDNSYAKYAVEKGVIVAFANAGSSITNINNIDSINGTNKTALANVLDSMKDSYVFAPKYNSIVGSIQSTVNDNQTVSDWGLVAVNNPNVTSWSNELDILLDVNNKITEFSGITPANYVANKNAKNALIGSVLDDIHDSSLFSGDQDIADSIVSTISNDHYKHIEKTHTTWVETFNNNLYLSALS